MQMLVQLMSLPREKDAGHLPIQNIDMLHLFVTDAINGCGQSSVPLHRGGLIADLYYEPAA